MKVPPDVRHLKSASVVLTKLVPADLPKNVTCNIQQTTHAISGVNDTRPDNPSSSVSTLIGETKSRSVVSRITSYPEDDRFGDISSQAADTQQRQTASFATLPNPSTDKKMGPPKRDFKHENSVTCTTANNLSYTGSPSKRRKLIFTTSPRSDYVDVLSEAEFKEGNMTSNANEQTPTASQSNIPILKDKISDTLFGETQHASDTVKQEFHSKGTNASVTGIISKELPAKNVDDKAMKKEGNRVCNAYEQSSKSKAYVVDRYDGSKKRPTLSHINTIDCLNLHKSSKKSKIKIENITAKLMREKQEAGKSVSPESINVNSSPYFSNVKRESLGSVAYTSIIPINRQLSSDQRGHRTRKRPVQKQYVRAGSAMNVSLKEEIIPKERCSSVPSSGVSKLKETRKLLKTAISAISASTVSSKIEHTTLEDWMEGIPKNVPNILVKSKCVTNSKGISKKAKAATCSQSSTSDQLCKDSCSEKASAELNRLQKIKGIGNPEIMTKIKPKRNRKKQSESFTDQSLQPGPSGYRKVCGAVVGKGNVSAQSPHRSVLIGETGRRSPNKERKSNAVNLNYANSFTCVKDFQLPVKGSQMTINKTPPQKGKHVILTYNNEIGSNNPISFNFSSNTSMDAPEETTEDVNTTTIHSKSTPTVKPVVQMGSFAISKSQEIIPIKPNESFLTPVTMSNVITPKRLSHAISYADYCAQMDNVEASQDVVNRKPRRVSESDVIKVSELRKGDVENHNNLNDQLRNDANILLKKLNQLHVNNTTCSEDTTTARSQSSGTVDVLHCGEVVVKQEKEEEPNKADIDDDDDVDSVHLSDHRYTKTPDASPAKSLTKGILHKTSTQSGTVVMNRKQTPQGDSKQPVYAIKYGDKLFLIHGKDDRSNGAMATNNSKQGTSTLKAISPKIEIKTEKVHTIKDSPYLTKKKSNRKVNTGKLVSKRKLDFLKQLVLNQKCLKRKKKQERQSKYSCRSNRTSVNRNAKVVYITRTNGRILTTTSRVNITLTRGTDVEIKRWSRYADFKARLTYHNDGNTLIHMTVDELQPGFYKLMPVSDMSDTKTVTVLLTCLPPHPDVITEGDSFIAVGPMRHNVDTGQDVKQTEEWSSCQIGRNLASILPATAMCHGSLYSSDTSYRPKMDAHEWYGAGVFDIFTRKYCRQKRVVQRRKWNRNPYEKAFS